MEMIRRFFLFMGLMFICLLLQGCPKSTALTIYNNTGTDLTVQLKDRRTGWGVGTSLDITDDKSAISWEDLTWEGDPQTYFIPTLTIKHGADILNYKLLFRGLSEEYVKYSNNRIQYYLQMESDAALYVIKSREGLPIKVLTPQPEGFPIKPTKEN